MSPLINKILNAKGFQYILGGFFWSGVSFTIIFILNYQGMNPYLANFTGYVIGLTLSFIVQRYVIFTKSQNTVSKQIILFLFNFIFAYIANLLALWFFIYIGVWVYLAHLLGAIVYTLMFYLISRYLVFR